MTRAYTSGERPLPARGRGISLLLALFALGCGSTAPNPFIVDAGPDAAAGEGGGDAGGGAGGGEPHDAGPDADSTLGGPCNDDAQCDDGVSCTFDACDTTLARCRFVPDDASCQNGAYCDGVERCDGKLGCAAGAPVSCSDGKVCTIDACVESTGACTHVLRDADGDGSVDDHCLANADCDDADPKVSPLVAEVCGNKRDDDCDGAIDEPGCSSPAHDSCLDPLEITAPGAYQLDTTAAAHDFAASCSVANVAGARDVVAALILPKGPPIDVEITARVASADVAVALLGQCGDPSSEIACSGSFYTASGRIAKVRGRGLGAPDESVALPVYVTTDAGVPVTLDVAFLPAEPAPSNETCGTASPIAIGVPVLAPIIGVATDVGSACKTATGDLVYSFDLAQPSDVHVYASSMDGDALPRISLRDADCALPEDEIACQLAPSAHVFRHALPAGSYHVAVSASAPTTVSTTVVLAPPTQAPADEACAGAPSITPNETIDVDLSTHQDDVSLGCLPGAVDAVYGLDLPVTSDVLLIERISQGDKGALELALPACASPSDELACFAGAPSPIRASKRKVPAGEYRVIAESLLAQPVQLTALVRPAVAPVIVPFSDACADALPIPETGGFFQGTTANAVADFNAGCDSGGVPQGGARDQLLRLELSAQRRVVLDMSGSAFTTLLDVRKGPGCPGEEVAQGCAVGYSSSRSFLDLTLGPGVYFIQIDGFNKESGPWFLDVRVVDP
ncbi:putative metal-binding motif-containing protein [Polyangium aurulentum]|uniref:putative metal-binding motif-containing protein n=1 Tax=Polyangium aurulentum TaxID=2567896 RepID=UPI0010ADFFBF|nr:putative metal-binding motif-containing protein [Polyangium aurulentum]UQA62437.1 putative metal-binding motif-containing protein [Polyangium aurulentum]